MDENNDCVYDDDHNYEPIENDGEMSSDDSYISANEDSDETTDEEEDETEEVMDE